MKVIRLNTDGTTEILETTSDWDKLAALIGCDWIEVVRPKHNKYVLVVDEEGLLKDKPKLNPLASFIYGILEHDQPVVGNALLMDEVFGNDGPELSGLEEPEELKETLDDMLSDLIPILQARGY